MFRPDSIGGVKVCSLTTMASPNGLICFTNCLLPLEDGSLVNKELWIDERRGVILDAQVYFRLTFR